MVNGETSIRLPGRNGAPLTTPAALVAGIQRIRSPMWLLRSPESPAPVAALEGGVRADGSGSPEISAWRVAGLLPPAFPEWLGDRGFGERHGLRFPYVVGEMARGLTSTRMVIAAVRAGCMAFYGSAGQSLERIDAAIREIGGALGAANTAWGCNLIHTPQESHRESAAVDLFLERGVRRVSASAFMKITPQVVRYAAKGMRRDASGHIQRQNHLFPKISRPEVAAQFIAPPPATLLRELAAAGLLTEEECHCAALLPVAEEITVEGDSGGHTDNRLLTALFPAVAALRDRLVIQHRYPVPVRLGAAGGLGTPNAVAAAFAMGAAYVMTGSINQSAIESGLSPAGREMLAAADMADTAMAPAADMFEMGVKVQVLKRGTLFPQRAQRLFDLYRAHDGLEDIPTDERQRLEKEVFLKSLEEVWHDTRAYFQANQPELAEKGDRDAKLRMALVFRWYLFMASRWPMDGVPERRSDYQIWCGPVMGTFNRWVAGSFLEPLENRGVDQIAWNLLEGAAVVSRAQQLRSLGVAVPDAAFNYRPRPLNGS